VIHPGEGKEVRRSYVKSTAKAIFVTYCPSMTLGALLQVSTLPHAIPQESHPLTQRVKSLSGRAKLTL